MEAQVQAQPQPQPQYETFTYSADTSKVMNILVRSIYTDRDIFLRELISNASDAIKKACIIGRYANNEILISYNKDTKELIIQDSGCGITKDDLVTKIGSIGTSGTKQFQEMINENKLIGQFGVGFYSVYLVSNNIQIITKPIQENKTYEWVSTNDSSYSIRELENFNEFERGTRIIIKMSEELDSLEYLEEEKLIGIIKTHSSYIEYPIMFQKENKTWEKINWVPIWAKPRDSITHQEYVDFYLNNIQDNLDQIVKDPPIIYKHFNVEGAINFTALLYVPEKAPFNLFEPSKRGQSLKLYTKNVLITADHKNLYPKWMEFIKGIVDTSDIELNVSRQTVQNTSKLTKICNQLTKKTIDMLEELYEDEEKYNKFYKQFADSIKNGIHEEYSREHTRDHNEIKIGNGFAKRLLRLLKFNTSHGRYVGFLDYIKNMKSNQKAIYYIAGDKKEVIEKSPFMDKLNTYGYEVLYFENPIDEYIKGFLTTYVQDSDGNYNIVGVHDEGFDRFKEPDMSDMKTKVFVDVSRDKLLITENENVINKEQADELCSMLKQIYEEKLNIKFFEVKLDEKFSSVPAIIVNHVHLSAQLEKLLKNSAASKRAEQYNPAFERKDMLISNSHKICEYLYQKLCIEKQTGPDVIKVMEYMYQCALLSGGYELTDSNKFVKYSIELMTMVLKL